MAQEKLILVLTTAGSLPEAKRLAQGLLTQRLAACINLIPHLQSWYWWKGKQVSSLEILLLIKTSRRKLPLIARFLKRRHSYELPELLALPFLWSEPRYFKWLKASIKSP